MNVHPGINEVAKWEVGEKVIVCGRATRWQNNENYGFEGNRKILYSFVRTCI